jgi:hypothetical protein
MFHVFKIIVKNLLHKHLSIPLNFDRRFIELSELEVGTHTKLLHMSKFWQTLSCFLLVKMILLHWWVLEGLVGRSKVPLATMLQHTCCNMVVACPSCQWLSYP